MAIDFYFKICGVIHLLQGCCKPQFKNYSSYIVEKNKRVILGPKKFEQRMLKFAIKQN